MRALLFTMAMTKEEIEIRLKEIYSKVENKVFSFSPPGEEMQYFYETGEVNEETGARVISKGYKTHEEAIDACRRHLEPDVIASEELIEARALLHNLMDEISLPRAWENKIKKFLNKETL